jgi:hypothetical protein
LIHRYWYRYRQGIHFFFLFINMFNISVFFSQILWVFKSILKSFLYLMLESVICVTNDHRYVPLVVSTSRSFPHSWLITGFVTWLTRRVPLVEQDLPTFPEHLNPPTVFSGVRVTRSLLLCVCFVDRCLSFCPFSFGHCVVCSSSIYEFWLPLWYLQTLLR